MKKVIAMGLLGVVSATVLYGVSDDEQNVVPTKAISIQFSSENIFNTLADTCDEEVVIEKSTTADELARTQKEIAPRKKKKRRRPNPKMLAIGLVLMGLFIGELYFTPGAGFNMCRSNMKSPKLPGDNSS